MTPFWNPEKPLTQPQSMLLQATIEAHFRSSFRDNLSSTAVAMSAKGAGEFTKSIAAALSMLGAEHGPIVQAYQLLEAPNPAKLAASLLASKLLVPGWGSSFERGAPDPTWAACDAALMLAAPGLYDKIAGVTAELAKKKLHPNPACYTAATAIVVGIPPQLAPWIFVAGRLNAWGKIFLDNRPEMPTL